MTWTIRRRSDFGPLRAIVAGRGPLVLLIHGVGLQAEAWGAQIDALSPRCRVVAVDMPGHGDSPPPAASDGLAAYASAIAAGLETQAASALVVGHSMGAMIALELACRAPHLVAGVAALNAIYQRSPEAAAAVQARANALDGQSLADPSATLARWFGADASAERAACAEWLAQVSPAAYRHAYRVFADENGPNPQTLAGMPCPALFMTGGAEPNSTPAMSQAMARLAPKGRAEIINHAAHMMPMTHPGAVNTALTQLIDAIWPKTDTPAHKPPTDRS